MWLKPEKIFFVEKHFYKKKLHESNKLLHTQNWYMTTGQPWIFSLHASYGIEEAKVGSLIQSLAFLMCLSLIRCCFAC